MNLSQFKDRKYFKNGLKLFISISKQSTNPFQDRFFRATIVQKIMFPLDIFQPEHNIRENFLISHMVSKRFTLLSTTNIENPAPWGGHLNWPNAWGMFGGGCWWFYMIDSLASLNRLIRQVSAPLNSSRLLIKPYKWPLDSIFAFKNNFQH